MRIFIRIKKLKPRSSSLSMSDNHDHFTIFGCIYLILHPQTQFVRLRHKIKPFKCVFFLLVPVCSCRVYQILSFIHQRRRDASQSRFVSSFHYASSTPSAVPRTTNKFGEGAFFVCCLTFATYDS